METLTILDIGMLVILAGLIAHAVQRQARDNKMFRMVEAMYKMHDKYDDDGVPVWYVRSSLEVAVAKLADNIDKQSEVLRAILDEQKELRHEFHSERRKRG